MPKMKTKSSAKKRFRVRPGGTVKRGQAFKRHILTKKSTTRKRQLRGAVKPKPTAVCKADHPGATQAEPLCCFWRPPSRAGCASPSEATEVPAGHQDTDVGAVAPGRNKS